MPPRRHPAAGSAGQRGDTARHAEGHSRTTGSAPPGRPLTGYGPVANERLTWSANLRHAPAENVSTGPVRSWVSRTRTADGVPPTSTQPPPFEAL
jgi:hypothetical protein